MKGWKKIFHANRDQKKAGVTIHISDKIDFKTKAVKRDKEGHYIMIKGSIQEEVITILNIYAQHRSTTICKTYANKSEKSMAPHSSTLAWKIPWMEDSGRLQSMRLLRVRHD